MHRLTELRKNLDNMKQGEFAKRISTTQGHVSDIENGRKDLSERTIKLICSEFNVNENWLRTGEGEMFIENDGSILAALSAEFNLTDWENRMLETYLRLPSETRAAAKGLLVNLARAIENGEVKSVDEFIFVKPELIKLKETPIATELTLEQQADAFAALARERFLREKKQESSTSFASESDAG